MFTNFFFWNRIIAKIDLQILSSTFLPYQISEFWTSVMINVRINRFFSSFMFGFRDVKNLIGEAICGICQESFSTSITGKYLLFLNWMGKIKKLMLWQFVKPIVQRWYFWMWIPKLFVASLYHLDKNPAQNLFEGETPVSMLTFFVIIHLVVPVN